MTDPRTPTAAAGRAKRQLRSAWLNAHPNQPIPEGIAEVDALFLAIEAEARAAERARLIEGLQAMRYRPDQGMDHEMELHNATLDDVLRLVGVVE